MGRVAAALLIAAVVAVQTRAAESGYNQEYRPQYHFSPREHWTNDPNGVVYFDGEYHLFFQYNPFGNVWGHMSWGHAVSRDLLHWQELPVAIPESDGVMIFTGSTVVDQQNSSGFCAGGKPCLVAVYTGFTAEKGGQPSLQTQNLAYSNDKGRTWTKYNANPVLNLNMPDFRDPDVFWSSAAKAWVMAVSLPNDHKVRFYRSTDLKKWDVASDFGPAGATSGQWECPVLLELPVDGGKERRWVLKVGLNPGGLQGGSGEQYFVGKFDGKQFINDNPATTALWTDYGKDCYCGLGFNHLPANQPQVMIGWMSNWQYAAKVPTTPWRGQMTIPRQLSLKTLPEGIRFFQKPVESLSRLSSGHAAFSAQTAGELNAELKRKPIGGDSFRLKASIALGSAREAGWKVLAGDATETVIGYDGQKHELFVDRTKSGTTNFSKDFPARVSAPLAISSGKLELDMLIDRSSVEVFAQQGQVAMTNLVYPLKDAHGIEVYATGGKAGPVSAEIWTIKSIW